MRSSLLRRFMAALSPLGVLLAAVLINPVAASAAFPGANGKIAYSQQNFAAGTGAIFSSNPDGSSPTNLSAAGGAPSSANDSQPAWSADGNKIAFVRQDPQTCSGQIWTMNQDGTGQTDLSNDAISAGEFNPAWGPDGSIAFVRGAVGGPFCASNTGDIWVRKPDGTLVQLTTGGNDNLPAISPDGTKIAFTRTGSGGPHILVMNADGTGTPTDLGPGLKPNWSPDGTMIAFSAPSSGGPPGGPVWVMDANGGNRQMLNSTGTQPAWSPDGTQITYVQSTGGIGVMDANGNNPHPVPGTVSGDVKPDWQPIEQAITATGTTVNAVEGQSFTATVATFKDPDANSKATDYKASIDWGDGSTPSTGTISGSGGNFTVTGTHSYTEEGSFTIKVTITDVSDTANTATATSHAIVADAALHSTGVSVSQTSLTFNGTIALFTDSDPNGTVSDYSASINWGDGRTSSGTIGTRTGGFTVTGSHTYKNGGTYHVRVTIKDVGGSTTTAFSTITIPVRGTARLAGVPGACVVRPATLHINGKRIASVTWFVNGKKVAGKIVRHGKNYTATVTSPRGVHNQLTVKVRFASASHTPARTFHATITGCPPPAFTG